MKTRNNNLSFSFIIILIFSITSIIPGKSVAQEEKTYKVKGTKGVLNCTEVKKTDNLFFSNAKDDETKIHKEYNIKENVDPSFLGYRYGIHDQFVEAFRKSFSKERLEKLASTEEKITIFFNLDQNGKYLFTSFVLNSGTQVDPDEILTLEENLKALVKFVPIRKSEYKFLDGVFIKTTFKEILNGEIPFIRKSDKYLQELEKLENGE